MKAKLTASLRAKLKAFERVVESEAVRFGVVSAFTLRPPHSLSIKKLRELHGIPGNAGTLVFGSIGNRDASARMIQATLDRGIARLGSVDVHPASDNQKVLAFRLTTGPTGNFVEEVYSDGKSSLQDLLALRSDWQNVSRDLAIAQHNAEN